MITFLLAFAGASLAKGWYTKKGGRLKTDRESSELENLLLNSGCKILKKNPQGIYTGVLGSNKGIG
jgi:hypothetical protein